ncbi:uncharacterized protein C16orf95 homolog isoform X4 [Sorex araneus]|uniref:uncharacterized protein C16orf95 homolog isoform X4 n=1 Tax=Sorex araneus TaxID=42254 RepID=UPI002433F2FC|nr:uncharacterized protein C16orf95 homolog isoform X4 [Sorex araneus]
MPDPTGAGLRGKAWATPQGRTQALRTPCSADRRAASCGCLGGLGGRLPVPRAEVALPYWVPVSLRPRQQVPKAARACPCPCHRFGGRFPAPRDQAVLPYWVPPVLRFPRKAPRRAPGAQGSHGDGDGDGRPALSCLAPADRPPDACPCYGRWRVLLRGRQLWALRAAGWAASGLAPLLPLGLLALLQALLRLVLALRHFFWV